MTKSLSATFGSAMLLITLYGALANSTFLSYFMDTRPAASIIRAALVLVVVGYCFATTIGGRRGRNFALTLGLGLIFYGVLGFFSPNTLSGIGFDGRLLDAFFALEWGFITVLVAVEHPTTSLQTNMPALRVSRDKAHHPSTMRINPV